MGAVDIHAEVLGWVLDELGKQAFGEDYGAAVSLGAAQVMTPQGPQVVPAWQMMVTARSPVLKEGALHHGPLIVGGPRPVEAEVRGAVTEGVRLLRDLAASKLARGNGKAPARLS